jgi:hypothetical protein
MSKMRKILGTLVAILGLAGSSLAFGCQCGRSFSPRQALEVSSAVFAGTVSRIVDGKDIFVLTRDPDVTVSVAEFEVLRIWKGEQSRTIRIVTGFTNCDYRFEVGRTYLVYAAPYANLASGRLGAKICLPTKAYEDAHADLEELGSGQPVEADPKQPGTDSQPRSPEP